MARCLAEYIMADVNTSGVAHVILTEWEKRACILRFAGNVSILHLARYVAYMTVSHAAEHKETMPTDSQIPVLICFLIQLAVVLTSRTDGLALRPMVKI